MKKASWLLLVTVFLNLMAAQVLASESEMTAGIGLPSIFSLIGIVFGLAYLRWRRVGPLVVAHVILDIVSFVGYALLAPFVSWL